MATIVEMINPLTGLPEQVDKLDHTAQEIDDAVGRSLPGAAIDASIQAKPNPNLLDNWYFGNPVNQRGDTQYTGAVAPYFIDRWKCGGYNQTIELTQQGLHWSSNTGIWLAQPIENYDDLVGKTVTVSAIIDGVLYSATGVVSSSSDIAVITKGNVQLEVTSNEKGVRFVTYSDQSTPEISILAAKLELGSQQTLAHQDADGNWVLNEIPDYGEQLAKCQRYCQVFDLTAGYTVTAFGIATEQTAWRGLFPIFTKLRAKPVLVVEGENKSLALHGNGTAINISNLTPSIVATECNGVGVVYGGLSLTKNQCYVLQAYGCKIILSADL